MRYLLSDQEKYEILCEVSDEEQLITAIEQQNPDLVILDHNQPGKFSHSTVSKVQSWRDDVKFLIISADSDKSTIDKVLGFGVNSFLTKSCGEEEIYDAIKASAKGEKYFCTNILNYLLEKSFSKEEESFDATPLTPRELEIVRLVAKGLIAKEIAEILHLSTHTIYTHRKKHHEKTQPQYLFRARPIRLQQRISKRRLISAFQLFPKESFGPILRF